jgi:hypothetical protein
MAAVGEERDEESEVIEEVGDKLRGGGGVKLSVLRSGSKGEFRGET